MEFFGEDCDLRKITPGQCDDFRENLNRTLAENTVRKTLSRCKQFFGAAVRKRIISENPLGDMKNIVVTANRSRDHFVTEAEAMAVLRSCPDAEWRLIFSLARWGGLRIPSELLELRWGDVDWENEMLVIRSPKTQQYQGHWRRARCHFGQSFARTCKCAWTIYGASTGQRPTSTTCRSSDAIDSLMRICGRV